MGMATCVNLPLLIYKVQSLPSTLGCLILFLSSIADETPKMAAAGNPMGDIGMSESIMHMQLTYL